MQTEIKSCQSGATSPQWYPHVHILRAFAALSVLIYHVIEVLPWEGYPNTGIWSWFRVGWMGVDLFFVISGFVIMHSALTLYGADPVSARRTFMVRRSYRILPLYVVTGVVYLCVNPAIFHDNGAIAHIITHVLLIHNWWSGTHGSINPPSSTIATEFQFYLFIFLLIPLLARARILPMFLSLVLLAWCSRVLSFEVSDYMGWGHVKRMVYATQMPSMLDLFGFGMVIAKIFCASQQYLEQRRGQLLAGVAILFCATAYIAATTYMWHAGDYWYTRSMIVFWRSIIGLTFALLLLLAVLMPPKLFQNNPLHRAGYYLGEVSYGIYLWHFPVILFLKRFNWSAPEYFLAAVLCITIALSSLSWHWLEKPSIQYARRKAA